MVSKTVRINNLTGLHLRPAQRLCEEAIQYKASICLKKGETTANVKSLLSVLGACIKCGDEIEFICDGEDENEALEAVVETVSQGLGE